MRDREHVELLEWALPRLGLRYRGFSNVRRQVCRRVAARIAALGLPDVASYRRRLEEDPSELAVLGSLAFVTISRFYRDRELWDAARAKLLPELAALASARGERTLTAWSAGCASGEEPYTLAIVWQRELAPRFPDLELRVLATDLDDAVLARAARGVYEPSSLRELPEELRASAFEPRGALFAVREEVRASVTFRREDVRTFTPPAPVHLVMCRNVAFTYFAVEAQRDFVQRAAGVVAPGGLLFVGRGEALPDGALGFARVPETPLAYRRVTSSSRS